MSDALRFDVRLREYSPTGTRKGVLPISTFKLVDPYGDVPSVRFQVSQLASGTLPEFPVVAFEYSIDGGAWVEPENGRFVCAESSDDEKEEAQLVSFIGLGLIPWLLSRTYLHWSASAKNGERTWGPATAGYILTGMLTESKNRGWAPYVTTDFTTTKDSAGNAWPTAAADKITQSYRLLTPIWDVLSGLVSQGMCEYSTQGTKLRLLKAGSGVDRSTGSNPVRLGTLADAVPVRRSINELFTHLTVVPEKARSWLYLTNTGADSTFGRLESTMTQSGVKDHATATKLAQPALAMGKASKNEVQATYNAQLAEFLPWKHYSNGDMVLVRQKGAERAQRVVEIAVEKTVDGDITVTTVMSARFRSLMSRLANRTGAATIGSLSGGSGVPLPAGSAPSSALPAVPQSFAVASNVGVWAKDGSPKSEVKLTWAEVLEDIEGAEVDVDQYEVWGRVGAAKSVRLAATDSLEVTFRELEPGTEVFYKVRARAVSGDWSDFTGELSVTPVAPATVLSAPSAPQVSQKLGVVSVRWDGLLGAAVPPAQFKHVYLTVATSVDGVYTATGQTFGRAGAATVADIPAGAQRWFKLHAVDSRGVASAPSGAATITVSSDWSEGKMGQVDTDLGTLNTNLATLDGELDAANVELGKVKTTAGAALPRIIQSGATKTFHGVLNWGTSIYDAPGTIVIDTPITFGSYMTLVKISGYYYMQGKTEIDATIAGYIYTSANPFVNTSQTSAGSKAVTLRWARKITTGTIAIFIDGVAPDRNWYYPKINVDQVIMSHATPPDSFGTGWTAALRTDLTGYDTVTGTLRRDLDDSNTLTQAWRTMGTTTIDGGKITADSVTAGQILAGTIGADELGANSVIAGKIDAGAVTADKILAGAVTTDKMTANTIQGDRINARTLAADKLVANSITAGEVAANAITAEKLNAKAVTAVKIDAGAIEAQHISLGAKLPTATPTNRVPAPPTDAEYWGKVVDGSVNLQAVGGVFMVSASAAGIVLAPTDTASSNLAITARNPIPESRKIVTKLVTSGVSPDIFVRLYTATGTYLTVRAATSGVQFDFLPGEEYYAIEISHQVGMAATTVQSASVFEAIGTVATETQQGVTIDPSGIRLTTEDGGGSIDLTTNSNQFLSIQKLTTEGYESQASITSAGVGQFQTVVANDDVNIRGTQVLGTFESILRNGAADELPVFDRLARGVVARGTFLKLSGTGIASAGQALASVSFEAVAGRSYMLVIDSGLSMLNGAGAGTTGIGVALSNAPIPIDAVSGYTFLKYLTWGAGTPERHDVLRMNRVMACTPGTTYDKNTLAEGTNYLLVKITNSGGSSANVNSNANEYNSVALVDIGPAVGSMIDFTNTASSAGGSTAPPGTAVTKTWNANWSRSWGNNGATVFTGQGGSQWSQQNALYQGYSSYWGNQGSMWGFPALGISGRTITACSIYMRNRHFYNSGGGVANLGTSTASGTPASHSSTNKWNVDWGKGVGAWVGVPSSLWPAIASGSIRAFTLGISGSRDAFGYWDGFGQADPPKIRITYK